MQIRSCQYLLALVGHSRHKEYWRVCPDLVETLEMFVIHLGLLPTRTRIHVVARTGLTEPGYREEEALESSPESFLWKRIATETDRLVFSQCDG